MHAAFDDGSPQYELFANTPREAEEWILMLQQATYVVCVCMRVCLFVCVCVCVYVLTVQTCLRRYQHLLSKMAELRGRLLQITGEVCTHLNILCSCLFYALYLYAM